MPGDRIEYILPLRPEGQDLLRDSIIDSCKVIQRLVEMVKVMQDKVRWQASDGRMSPGAQIDLVSLGQELPSPTS
jgi:hypothetical protein